MKIGIIIGRFQPPHIEHFRQLFVPAISDCDRVLVLLGSSETARDIRNPFTAELRVEMIIAGLLDLGIPTEKLMFHSLVDFPYDDKIWQWQVRQVVNEITNDFVDHELFLYGCKKDSSTHYLDWFPECTVVESELSNRFGSTDIRQELFHYWFNFKQACQPRFGISDGVHNIIAKWRISVDGVRVYNDCKAIQDFKQPYQHLPYPPIFQTVDALVLHRGKFLVIQRKNFPGKGLLALPGGYVNADETLAQAVVRELQEETGLQLEQYMSDDYQVFDHPNRSCRGRVITTLFTFVVPGPEVLNVIAGDDAADYKWCSYQDHKEFLEFAQVAFEDHHHLVAITIAKHTQQVSQ